MVKVNRTGSIIAGVLMLLSGVALYCLYLWLNFRFDITRAFSSEYASYSLEQLIIVLPNILIAIPFLIYKKPWKKPVLLFVAIIIKFLLCIRTCVLWYSYFSDSYNAYYKYDYVEYEDMVLRGIYFGVNTAGAIILLLLVIACITGFKNTSGRVLTTISVILYCVSFFAPEVIYTLFIGAELVPYDTIVILEFVFQFLLFAAAFIVFAFTTKAPPIFGKKLTEAEFALQELDRKISKGKISEETYYSQKAYIENQIAAAQAQEAYARQMKLQQQYAQQMYRQPMNAQPTYQQPMNAQPVYQQPTYQTPPNQPTYHQSMNNAQPTYRQPMTTQPTYRQPAAQQPAFSNQAFYSTYDENEKTI